MPPKTRTSAAITIRFEELFIVGLRAGELSRIGSDFGAIFEDCPPCLFRRDFQFRRVLRRLPGLNIYGKTEFLGIVFQARGPDKFALSQFLVELIDVRDL